MLKREMSVYHLLSGQRRELLWRVLRSDLLWLVPRSRRRRSDAVPGLGEVLGDVLLLLLDSVRAVRPDVALAAAPEADGVREGGLPRCSGGLVRAVGCGV